VQGIAPRKDGVRVQTHTTKRPRGRPEGEPHDWWPVFLAELRHSGNVTTAAEAAGVSRRTAYDSREGNPEFRRAWDDARETYLDSLEGDLGRQGLEDRGMPAVVAKLAVLKAYRPQYRDDRGINITVNQAPQQQLNVLLGSHEGRKLLEALTLRLHGQEQGGQAGLPAPEPEQ